MSYTLSPVFVPRLSILYKSVQLIPQKATQAFHSLAPRATTAHRIKYQRQGRGIPFVSWQQVLKSVHQDVSHKYNLMRQNTQNWSCSNSFLVRAKVNSFSTVTVLMIKSQCSIQHTFSRQRWERFPAFKSPQISELSLNRIELFEGCPMSSQCLLLQPAMLSLSPESSPSGPSDSARWLPDHAVQCCNTLLLLVANKYTKYLIWLAISWYIQCHSFCDKSQVLQNTRIHF